MTKKKTVSVLEHTVRSLEYGPKIWVHRLTCNIAVNCLQKGLSLRKLHLYPESGKRGGLVVNASDSGSRDRGFEPHSGQTVLCP